MKKLLLILVIYMSSVTLYAQYRTQVTVSDINNTYLKSKIEKNLSAFFTELNYACAQNREPNLDVTTMDENVKKTIDMLWRNSPIRCEETDIAEPCLKLYTGNEYEVRNIPIVFENFVGEEKFKEVAVKLDNNGRILSLHIISDMEAIPSFGGQEVTDLRRRQIVLDFVERFRTAYETKDIAFMENVFSDDALIIVGRNIVTRKENGPITTRTEFYKKTKQQYLNDLKRSFVVNKQIRIRFDNIKVELHPTIRGIYNVQLLQHYWSSTYHDDGYLSLVWDFTAGDDKPQIHVRVWQPDKDGFGKPISEDDIFSIEDVNFN